MTNFTDLQTKRRSIYALGKDVELSNQELIDTIQEAVLNTPTAFNSQTSRVVILLDEESDAFQNEIAYSELEKVTPVEAFEGTKERLKGFAHLFEADEQALEYATKRDILYLDLGPAGQQSVESDVESKTYTSEVRLIGGLGNVGGEQEVHFNLELAKELVGRALKDKEFTFKLVDMTDNKMVDLGETTNDATGKIVFSNLVLNQPGTYHYRVTEVPGNDSDVVYDKLQADVTVQVARETTDGREKLVAKVVYPDDVIFNNKLVTPAKAKIQFSKELSKSGVNQALTANEFQFVLKDSADHVVETVSNTADGRVAFSNLSFEKPGTYTYTVEEVKGNNEDIIYDGMKATVSITVTRDGEALVSSVTNPKDTIFNNYVKELKPAKAKFVLTKVLAGRQLQDGEFSFVLKDEKGNVVQTVTNDAKGNINFDSISYDKLGVYFYTVEEVKGYESNVVYDSMVAKLKVTVTKSVGDKENLLVVAVVFPLDTEFNNSYIPPKPPYVPQTPSVVSTTSSVKPEPAMPVQSSVKSEPQLPETGQASDKALLALGVAAEVAVVTGIAYNRRRKDI